MSQKLVEPHAIAFGGRDENWNYDMSLVNWDMAVEYFTWEATAWKAGQGDEEAARRSHALQDKAIEKYDFLFNHRPVYADPDGWGE